MKLDAKDVLKAAALVILALEAYWVLYLRKEPHAMSVAGAVSSLFGLNSAHENVQKYLDDSQGDNK